MEKKFLYEGKAKIVYATENPDEVVVYYKDAATAFDGKKKGEIENKGYLNAQISAYIFKYLEKQGIKTHFLEVVGEREQRVKRLSIIPVEVVVRNIAAGSLSKRLGLPEGTDLPFPVVELYYKNDELGDPMINHYHVQALNLATPEEIKYMEDTALKVNSLLKEFFDSLNILLVDFKLEFGRFHDQILLGDEISPDTCRFWDKDTREKLDKDRFRRDLGGVSEAYTEILKRIKEKAE
ncbi:phosphoribosylaminoimidazolesuccinocarboxamide synthase [Carboxydothermus islandicus]|uniref:Phosphoribosylaminoimidazole-succinocarboxamide synthase n=1 Tax=Carboxydothermus islandicus TaxID=661089 RepID=A0A1L8D4X4_9THEO|nr:phosphoribosylaminoimidazolesuccinocarboxamide synthase [Carboxydothermus islandicus]GAV26235.1 phosphoribosylaminoimidazolesuccinocarboxamide synthase [Carboxydothermus islandicus]